VRVSPRAGHNLLWLALFLSQAALASPPILSYDTYLGGAYAIAVDKGGNAYVGLTGSVVKLDPAGAHILATYAVPNFVINAVSLDSSGDMIAAGALQSASSSGAMPGAISAGITVGYVASSIPAESPSSPRL
jgi:hypothetical protein